MPFTSTPLREQRFLNEGQPLYVNTTGIMTFCLAPSQSKILHLHQYQQALCRLAQALANPDATASWKSYLYVDPTLLEISQALSQFPQPYPLAFAYDGPPFECLTAPTPTMSASIASSSSSLPPLPTSSYLPSSSVSSFEPNLLRLPWDPTNQATPIHCQLSARRLPQNIAKHLDQMLRMLCDACPGDFRLQYSDGLSGIEPGLVVEYFGSVARSDNKNTSSMNRTTKILQDHTKLTTESAVEGLALSTSAEVAIEMAEAAITIAAVTTSQARIGGTQDVDDRSKVKRNKELGEESGQVNIDDVKLDNYWGQQDWNDVDYSDVTHTVIHGMDADVYDLHDVMWV